MKGEENKAELFATGDKVRVVAQYFGHEFEIGEEVTLRKINSFDNDYEATNKDGTSWYVCDDEIELI